jgi:hypothetical protein
MNRHNTKMQTRLRFAAVFVIVAAGCSGAGRAPVNPPVLDVEPRKLDFGTVEQGAVVETFFTVRNVGGESVQIFDIRSTCPCTQADPENKYLPPGGATRVKVTFSTAQNPGGQDQTITVLAEDPRAESQYIQLTGSVRSRFYVEPVLHRLPFEAGDGRPAEVRSHVNNLGDGPLVIVAIAVNGEGITASLDGAKLPFSIAAGSSRDLVIKARRPKPGVPVSGSVVVETETGLLRRQEVVIRQQTEPAEAGGAVPQTAPSSQ